MAAYKSARETRMEIFVIYILMFFTVWTIYELNFFSDIYSNNAVLNTIVKNSIKYIVWTVPVFILLRYVYYADPVSYLRLDDNVAKGLIWGTAVGFLLIVYHVIRNYIMGYGNFNFDIDMYTWIHRIILIGFTEEVVFRGFILQKLSEELEFAYANAVASVLFLLIHFPGWYINGILSYGKITYFFAYAAFVLAFGLLQGYVLKRTKSLWACMVIHSINNLITTVTGI